MTETHPTGAAARLAVALVGHPAVERSWVEASVLAGYRVGGLAAHLVRSIETIRQYAEADQPAPDAVLVDAAGYYAAVLDDHHPVTSPFHANVRARGEGRVDAGHDVLVAEAGTALAWLESQRFDLERPVSVLDGTAIRLGDYLDTRLVELVIHSDDLSVSVGIDPPAFGDRAWRVVADVLAACARRRHSPRHLALALARPERYGPLGAFDAFADRGDHGAGSP